MQNVLSKGVNVEILVPLGITIVVSVAFSNFTGIVFSTETTPIHLHDTTFDVARLWCLHKPWTPGYKQGPEIEPNTTASDSGDKTIAVLLITL